MPEMIERLGQDLLSLAAELKNVAPDALIDVKTGHIIWHPENDMSDTPPTRHEALRAALQARGDLRTEAVPVSDAKRAELAGKPEVDATPPLQRHTEAQGVAPPQPELTLDEQIEQHIATTGAPAVSAGSIESRIVREYYFTAEDGVYGASIGGEPPPHHPALELTTFCVLVMANRAKVVGISHCLSPKNFKTTLGQQLARRDAIRRAGELEGYLLAEHLQVARETGA